MVEQKQPLHQHISELRTRLMVVVSALVVFTAVGLFFYDKIQTVLVAPLDEKLYYTSPAGGFNFSMQLALFFGIICTFPLFLYHVIRFIAPALKKNMRKKIWVITLCSLFLAALGASFAYFVSLPAALHFLTNFSDQSLESLITTQDYLSFLNIYVLGFMLIFQIPLFVYIISNITPMPPSRLIGGLRVVIVISVVAAAIITPTTDPMNLAIMAVPMILLYLFSIVVSWITHRISARRTADPSPVEENSIISIKTQDNHLMPKPRKQYFDVIPARNARAQKPTVNSLNIPRRAGVQDTIPNRQLLIQL